MRLEFLGQGYNRVNQKCFSFTLWKASRKTKYIYIRYSENTRVKLRELRKDHRMTPGEHGNIFSSRYFS